MDFPQSDFLHYENIIDSPDSVYGIFIIKKGCPSFLHWHKEPETYFFMHGNGVMILGNEVINIKSPQIVNIPPKVQHNVIPYSSYVTIIYHFPIGHFSSIRYHFVESRL